MSEIYECRWCYAPMQRNYVEGTLVCTNEDCLKFDEPVSFTDWDNYPEDEDTRRKERDLS